MLTLVMTAGQAAHFYGLCFCIMLLMVKGIYEAVQLYSKFKEKK